MKNVNIFSAILLLAMTGCGGNKQSDNEFITVDVTASYPKKELILQDFMDVEYIPLETGGEFYCQGVVKAIGKEIMLVTNTTRDGDIFVFDRNGKGLRKINRLGRGGEEYTSYFEIILDEDNGEMFVNDISANRIMVYDLYGKFKRSIRYNEGIRYQYIYNFDRENLICDDSSFRVDWETPDKSPFIIISKQDGSIVKNIQISYKQKKTAIITRQIEVNGNSMSVGTGYRYFPIIPYLDSWILTEPSSDTLFRFLPDYSMVPFIVRTPSVQSMNPEVFLFPRILTDRYYLMESVKKESEFSMINLVYDRQEKTIYEYTLHNDDYSNKKTVDMIQKNTNDGIIFWQKIEADDLVESYEKGELKGRLKEIAAEVEEESNPVIMLVKYKE